MEISLTELKENLGKYILLAKDEDILLTKNGKVIARLTEPFLERKDKVMQRKLAEKLVGSIKSDYITLDELRAERLAE